MNLKRIIPLCLLAALCGLLSIEVRASFVDVYISQSGAGLMDGTSCANAKPASFFNNSGNWGGGAGQIGPATTAHACGTFAGALNAFALAFQGSGTAGNVITLKGEPGNLFTSPAWSSNGAISLGGQSFMHVTGLNITNTANGSGLANQINSMGIQASGASDYEIDHMSITNLYQHTSSTDTATDVTVTGCIYANGVGSNILIHDNVFTDGPWSINLQFDAPASNLQIYNNDISRVPHGIVLGGTSGGSGGTLSSVSIHNNHIHDFANWSTTTDFYHLTGFHFYGVPGHTAIANISVYKNLFDGAWGSSACAPLGNTGSCITAQVFEEAGGSEAGITGQSFYDNVGITDAPINNGLFGIYSGPGNIIVNNTMIGSTTSDGLCFGSNRSLAGMVFQNNVMTTCNQLINSVVTFASGSPDHNIYANGGSNAFVCNGNFFTFAQFNSWKACVGSAGDANSLAPVTAVLSASGVPQPTSPALGAGNNLTALGIAPLDSDISGAPRPSGSTPWTAGAFQINTGPIVTFAPTSVAFGNQVVATSSSPTAITLTNSGSATLTVSAVSITGANSGDFSQTNNCVGSIAAGMGCTINATFTPLATGARSASISVTDTAPGSPHTVPLSGTGTAPAVSIAPASVAFGNQAVGTSSAAVPVTVTNSGTSTLTISNVTLTGGNPGDFSEMDNCVGMVAAGMSCTVNVTFTPTTTGARSASVSVADNASGSPHTAPLTGTGTTSGASLSPTSLAFGSSLVGVSTSPQTITLTNTGGATLTISSITITGSNPGDFTRTTTCGGTLTAGSNCGISVTFTPTAAGARSASVSVADSAAASPHTAALSGTGTSPSPSTTPAPTAIILAALPNGTVGTPYPATAFSCIGGSPPCSAWSVGPLVPGLTLSAAGVLGGTPTAAGNYALKISAVDVAGHSVFISPALAIAAAPVAVPPVPGPPGKTPVTMSCVRTGSTSKYACTVLTWK